MIQVTPHLRILVAVEPADFRRGIDGLAQVCRGALDADPFSEALVVFRNRRATAIKLLIYDGQSLWLCHEVGFDSGPKLVTPPLELSRRTNCTSYSLPAIPTPSSEHSPWPRVDVRR